MGVIHVLVAVDCWTVVLISGVLGLAMAKSKFPIYCNIRGHDSQNSRLMQFHREVLVRRHFFLPTAFLREWGKFHSSPQHSSAMTMLLAKPVAREILEPLKPIRFDDETGCLLNETIRYEQFIFISSLETLMHHNHPNNPPFFALRTTTIITKSGTQALTVVLDTENHQPC